MSAYQFMQEQHAEGELKGQKFYWATYQEFFTELGISKHTMGAALADFKALLD